MASTSPLDAQLQEILNDALVSANKSVGLEFYRGHGGHGICCPGLGIGLNSYIIAGGTPPV